MRLIEWLESFNRKERFFLIGNALGNTKEAGLRLTNDWMDRLPAPSVIKLVSYNSSDDIPD